MRYMQLYRLLIAIVLLGASAACTSTPTQEVRLVSPREVSRICSGNWRNVATVELLGGESGLPGCVETLRLEMAPLGGSKAASQALATLAFCGGDTLQFRRAFDVTIDQQPEAQCAQWVGTWHDEMGRECRLSVIWSPWGQIDHEVIGEHLYIQFLTPWNTQLATSEAVPYWEALTLVPAASQ